MLNNSLVKILGFIVAVAMLFVGVYYLVNWQLTKQQAWINLNKVYNEFSLKKELEAKLKAVEAERKKVTDSLELNLKLLANQLEFSKKENKALINEFQQKKQNYFTTKQQFDEDNEQLKADYNTQVFAQMNQYIKEFAQENNINVILGADGTGAVMYATEKIEVTEPILIFINNKYKGIK